MPGKVVATDSKRATYLEGLPSQETLPLLKQTQGLLQGGQMKYRESAWVAKLKEDLN
jgi:hypothetical protein